MGTGTNLKSVSLNDLRDRCARESERFFQRQDHDPRFCYELFRRAFVDREQGAWEYIYELYQPLIAGWVISNPAFEGSGEEVDYFINRSLEKIWQAITPTKFQRFDEFRAVLGYLKMCVGSAIIDHVRRQERLDIEEYADQIAIEIKDKGPPLEDRVFTQVESELLWQEMKKLLSGEQEYYVLYASFYLNFKPREILDHFPEKFSDVQEIYRIKENILNRLRRNTDLIKSLGGHIEETA